ncbi:hypothetical protein BDR04DRAFT_1117694 [Suillus decipiens]|nr:hypothetical protein BDR04DRAFT_1117694 [Suillus decipiens]
MTLPSLLYLVALLIKGWRWMEFTFGDSQQMSSKVHEHRGLWQIAVHLIQAVEDEGSFTTSKIMDAATNPSDFQQIPIKDLFDFFYAEVKLYELLDLDANGIDNPEFLQADEILDEQALANQIQLFTFSDWMNTEQEVGNCMGKPADIPIPVVRVWVFL